MFDLFSIWKIRFYFYTDFSIIKPFNGSGKTTTCQTLLLRSNLPFLVIEPAKTEYRALLSAGMDNKLQIFTLGSEASPFRMNPFELVQGENFTAHVDMLTASFTSAFPIIRQFIRKSDGIVVLK